MSVVMVRQKVKDGSVEEAEAAARELFATLDRLRPEGLRYASTRVVDSSTFVISIFSSSWWIRSTRLCQVSPSWISRWLVGCPHIGLPCWTESAEG